MGRQLRPPDLPDRRLGRALGRKIAGQNFELPKCTSMVLARRHSARIAHTLREKELIF